MMLENQNLILPKNTIIIFHASVGSGHKSAAHSISEAFKHLKNDENFLSNLPDYITPETFKSYNIEVLDCIDFLRWNIDGEKAANLFIGATRPVYDLTWRYTFTGRLLWGGGTGWGRIASPKFTEYIRNKKPVAIICTHITAANLATSAKLITNQHFPIICVPTDYIPEGLWPHRCTDLFCAGSEAMAEILRPRLVHESNIAVTGIPTKINFSKEFSQEDKNAYIHSLGVDPSKKRILILAGANYSTPYLRFRDSIENSLPYLLRQKDVHVIFVCGKDRDYLTHMSSLKAQLQCDNLTLIDYAEDVALLMSSCDFAICKPGGLTVTECLCTKTPMIILGRAYGQEKANVRMLTSTGAAMHVITPRELIEQVGFVLSHPKSLDALVTNGSYIRRPSASIDIVRESLNKISLSNTLDRLSPKKRFFGIYIGNKPSHNR